MTPPTVPVTAWTAWIDEFAAGRDPSQDGLAPLDEALGPARAVLLRRLADVFVDRARRWSDDLQRRIDDPTTTTAVALGSVLTTARARLAPLITVAGSPLVPEEVRSSMQHLLATLRSSAQDALERSARRPARGRVDLEVHAVVREHDLTCDPPVRPRSHASPAPTTGGRRILL